ncbi:DUF262 domain-containing protein [Lysinibacillus capsici]|uniref:DUF262 domain-containing protein n=1 Tax=Lysinibacillus capsici TaxID=2115968 RepID=UPI003F29EAC7
MVVATALMSLKDVLQKFNQIIIPDVQRDYVMGSGGEKLPKLLDSIVKNNTEDQDFNFSCLVGYEDENNNLYIYDGQQRLVTLVCLCAYLNAESNVEVNSLLKKFTFTDRVVANDWLKKPNLINEMNAVDFTTYSMAQLMKTFKSNYKDKITFEFLINKVIFNTILVNKISDAEQFFLDINDGLHLESYELYKAELFHHMNKILEENVFKRFVLKLENQWLKFFLNYKYSEGNVSYCEEQILAFFLQYCTRMIWIEENGNAEQYDLNSVAWLTSKHLQLIEQIMDAILEKLDNNAIEAVTCFDSSYLNKSSSYSEMHWSIRDTNYNAMLKVFLRNIHNKKETNKDVIIWCYISNLPFTKGNKDALYKYLTFVKKLLNHNRAINDYGEIYHKRGGVGYKELHYSRYYIKGIPAYYKPKSVISDTESEVFVDELVVLNRKCLLNTNQPFIDVYLQLCKLDSLKYILEKEKKKQNSPQKELIEKYEKLPFINGLVDNLLNYTDERCFLKRIYDDKMYATISREQFWRSNSPYNDILNFISNNNLNMYSIMFSNISIKWWNYSGDIGRRHSSKASITALLPHTWYDLFTSENGIVIQDGSPNPFIKYLPDGWFEGQQIKQPRETEVEGKSGFAAGTVIPITVWDIEHFTNIFSWICEGENGNYIVNGREQNGLPYYLNYYNNKNWVMNKLTNKKKIFFTDDILLNRILLKKFKIITTLTGQKFYDEEEREIEMKHYLRIKKNYMRFEKLDNDYFFIKIDEIE